MVLPHHCFYVIIRSRDEANNSAAATIQTIAIISKDLDASDRAHVASRKLQTEMFGSVFVLARSQSFVSNCLLLVSNVGHVTGQPGRHGSYEENVGKPEVFSIALHIPPLT